MVAHGDPRRIEAVWLSAAAYLAEHGGVHGLLYVRAFQDEERAIAAELQLHALHDLCLSGEPGYVAPDRVEPVKDIFVTLPTGGPSS